MLVSPTKALKLYKVSKPTIYSDMKSGKLSFTKDDRGKRKINVAELDRLYDQREEGTGKGKTKNGKNDNEKTFSNGKGEGSTAALKEEIRSIREELLKLHEQEKSRLEDQIEMLKEQVEEARKDKNNYMRLLEDHSKSGQKSEEDKKIEILGKTLEKFVNQEEERQKRIEERRKKRDELRRLKEEEEQSRGFWSKLFG